MKKSTLGILSGLIITFCSCSPAFKNYYFPLHTDEDILVYHYANPENPKLDEYWLMEMDPNSESLMTESYRYDFELYNTFVEKYDEYGAVLEEYTDYEYDKQGNKKSIPTTLNTYDVYKWDGEKSYHFSLEYVNKYGRFKFFKRRTYLGKEKITIEKEDYKTLKFKDDYFIHAIDQNDKYNFYQICYYAENKGMIRYERFIPNSGPRILDLTKVLSEDEFFALKKKFQEAEAEKNSLLKD